MIGLALTDYLLKNGVSVTALIREGSGKAVLFPRHPRLRVVECSLEHLAEYRPEQTGKCDWFFHFGWSGTTGAARNDVHLQNQNIRTTLSAAELAVRLGAEVFIGAGSQAEYGRTDEMLSPETPAFPETAYGTAKLCAGQMSRLFCRQQGIRHIWMRILSVYGPHNVEQSMLMTGIRELLAGKMPLYTAGEQRWDYLYAEDAARAFYLAAQKGKDGSVYCLGSGKARPLADYIREMRDAVNPNAQLGLGKLPYAKDQVMYLCADLSALTADTGFVPEYSFKEGIRRTVEWVRKYDEENQYHGSVLQ